MTATELLQTRCSKLADPYVERDATTLFIDLLLLKVGVYRHFLWNRTEARTGRAIARLAGLLLVLETCASPACRNVRPSVVADIRWSEIGT